MSALALSALPLGGAGLSLVLIRMGWSGRRGLAVAGWLLAALSLAVLTTAHGAWGLAMGAVGGMAAALALVFYAGWKSPIGKSVGTRKAPSVTLPRSWNGAGRRLGVFALVVPVAFAASLWLAYGLNAAMTDGGELSTNSVASVLFLQPVAWTLLMSWQMTRPGPREMILSPVLAAILGTLLWTLA